MLINFDHLKTTYNALVHKLKNFRGNWEQNDPAADDYIKNRTHYSEGIKEVTVLPQTVLTSDEVTLQCALAKGQKYCINWDGEQYECVARDYDGYLMIGNNAIYQWDNGVETDTGEPFALEAEESSTSAYIYLPNEGRSVDVDTTRHTISITTVQEVVHKLDKKFIDIPDNIVTTDKLEEVLPDNLVTSDNLADVATSGSYNDLSDKPVITEQVQSNLSEMDETSKSYVNGVIRQDSLPEGYPYFKYIAGEIIGIYYTATFTKKADGSYSASPNWHCSIERPDEVLIDGGKYVFQLDDKLLVGTYIDECYFVLDDGTQIGKYESIAGITGKLTIPLFEFGKYVGEGEHTISIHHAVKEYMAIDENYISDTIARVGDSYTKAESDAKYATNSGNNYIILIDQSNGYEYVAQMANGNLVTFCKCASIEIVNPPTETIYYDGDVPDLSSLVVMKTCQDNSTQIIENYSFSPSVMQIGVDHIDVIYEEAGNTYTAVIPVTVKPFTELLTDFNYTKNENGTYTITSWKETTNGSVGTELIVPDKTRIIV